MTLDDVFSSFGSLAEFARGAGCKYSTASEMRRRGSIPVRYWPAVIASAQSIGKQITPDDLMAAHAQRETAQ